MDDDGLVDPHPDDPDDDDGRHTMRLTERLRGGKRKQSQGEGLLQVTFFFFIILVIIFIIIIIIIIVVIIIVIITIITSNYDDYVNRTDTVVIFNFRMVVWKRW